MKKFSFSLFSVVLILCLAGISPYQAQAQTMESFNGFTAGDSLAVIGWSGADVTAKIVDSSGNKVLQNTIRNYNAAPVLMMVLPDGKTLADYVTFSFKGYFAQGDVGYKEIVVEAYQTKPTGQAFNTPAAKIGGWNRNQMGSTGWENIKIDITNTSTFNDTIYIAFGINCAGTGNVGGTGVTTIWLADDVKIAEEFMIVVDGNKDDFYGTLTGPSDGHLQIRSFAHSNNGRPKSDADLSAKVWTAWDNDWFYFYTEVMDDTISGAGTTNSYETDNLEIKIDPKATDSTQTGGGQIFDMRLTAPFTQTGAMVDTSIRSSIDSASKKWARRTITGGYALELAVKWNTIKLNAADSLIAKVDSVFGLGINVHDNDGAAGRNRQASITWAAVMQDQIWNTPKYLGTVKFLADNKLQFIPTNNMTGVTNPIPFDGSDYFNIMVDGMMDAFYTTLTGPSDGYLQIGSGAYSTNGAPKSDADLSAKVWTAWDNDWFYFYTEVRDDTISGAGTTNSYETDNLEIKIDPKATDSTQTGGGQIFDMRLTAPFTQTGAMVDTSIRSSIDSASKKWARRTITGGYALELAVKWNTIKLNAADSLIAKVDSVFGLGINVHDNDGAAGRNRQASVTWAAFLDDHVWDTPKLLGTVKFLTGNRLQYTATNKMTGRTGHTYKYDGTDIPLSVERVGTTVPATFSLGQNYPNPFNPTTTIQFGLPVRSNVRIMLYNMLGQAVAEMASGDFDAGQHKVTFNASHLSSAVYFYRLEAGSFTATKKLVLMK